MRRWLLDVTRRPVTVYAIAGAGSPGLDVPPIRMGLAHAADAHCWRSW